jgi:hypothetical protein
VPSLALIKGVKNFFSRLVVLCHNDKTTVIAELVNVGTLTDLCPVEATISGEVGVHFIINCFVKLVPGVSDSKNQAYSAVLRVGRSEHPITRVDLKIERAILIKIARDLFAIRIDRGGLDEFPLSTLVVGYVSSDLSLHLLLLAQVLSID